MEQLDSTISSSKSILEKNGVKLFINDYDEWLASPRQFDFSSVDVEDDEQGKFVGLAICDSPDKVFYFTELTEPIKHFLTYFAVIGHNFKSDMHKLKKWGVEVPVSNFFGDTMIMSYVINPTARSHGLKNVAKELLGLEWPSYRDMVGKGKKKQTLDKQPVEDVAPYCGMDAYSTFRLYTHLHRKMTPDQRRIYLNIEMPITRILYEMEEAGVEVSIPRLKELDDEFAPKLKNLKAKLIEEAGKSFNPNSPNQVLPILQNKGVDVSSTGKKVIAEYDHIPFVSVLLEYRKYEKLYDTYIKGLLSNPDLPRIHTTFNQIIHKKDDDYAGIKTTRLSSSRPNLHNIPTRTEDGDKVRSAFVAPYLEKKIVFDYSQIEYRLLAHFSRDPVLVQAYKDGKDVHEETGKLFGVDRYLGKTINFAAIYGAREKKISYTANIPVDKAKELLDGYWEKLPYVTAWKRRVLYETRIKGYIRTLNGHTIPIENINSPDKKLRWGAERRAINYIIQGSAAEVIKLAMIKIRKNGCLSNLQVHDELHFDIPNSSDSDGFANRIKQLMENVVTLQVPLIVDWGQGTNWQEAKK